MHTSEGSTNRPIDPQTARAARPVHRWLYVLLLAPFVGTLWVSSYAHESPRLFGFPFFYWYQLAWVFAAAGITTLVYLLTTPRRRGGPPGDGGAAAYPSSPAPSEERSRQR
jgi:cytochrome b561